MRHQESVARHDTSKAPDDLEAMRLKIAKLESEEVDAKTAYRDSLDKLEGYQEKYRGEGWFHDRSPKLKTLKK